MLCLIYLISNIITSKYKFDDPISRSLIPKNQRKLRYRKRLLLTIPIFIFIAKIFIMFHHNDNKQFWKTVKPFLSDKTKVDDKITLVDNGEATFFSVHRGQYH